MKIGEHHGLDNFIDWLYMLFGLGLLAAILTTGWKILDLLIEF